MKKSFIQTSKAWHSTFSLVEPGLFEEAIILTKDDDNNSVIEFIVQFYNQFHNFESYTLAKICIFDDGVEDYIECYDMLAFMSKYERWNPGDFFAMLINQGYEDATPIVADKEKQVKIGFGKEQPSPMVEKLANIIDLSKIPVTIITVGPSTINRRHAVG